MRDPRPRVRSEPRSLCGPGPVASDFLLLLAAQWRAMAVHAMYLGHLPSADQD